MSASYFAHLPIYFVLWLFQVYAQINAQTKEIAPKGFAFAKIIIMEKIALKFNLNKIFNS